LRSKHRVAIEILVDLSEAKGEQRKGIGDVLGVGTRYEPDYSRNVIEMD
jgi:hypothetical protein